MNVHALPTILSEYEFHTRNPDKPAFHVQKLTCGMLSVSPRGYVLNDLGTGKTRCVLWTYDYLKKTEQAKKLLVICPLSAMMKTWAREIMREFWWLKYVVLYGTKAKRLELLSQDVAVYIVNHHGVEILLPELRRRYDIDTVAADELAVYRNGRSNLTLSLKELVRGRKWTWGVTGSPMPRAVTDVWGPCSAITPDTIPRYFSQFRAQLMIKVSQFRWEAKPGAEKRALACMQPSVRYRLDEIVELPPRVIHYYEASLTSQQKFVYDGMRQKAVALIGEKKIDALNAGAVLSKLLQIALGYVYDRTGSTISLENTPRLQLILDLVDSTSQKVILFAPFKSAVAALSEMLTNNKIEHGVVTGDTSLAKRNVIFSAFQDTEKYKVLLAHPACMAHSLTLTAATTIIWAGPVTSLDVFNQANARIYRIGQEHKTLIAMVGGTDIEKRMYRMLGRNEALQNRFLELLEGLTLESYGART